MEKLQIGLKFGTCFKIYFSHSTINCKLVNTMHASLRWRCTLFSAHNYVHKIHTVNLLLISLNCAGIVNEECV